MTAAVGSKIDSDQFGFSIARPDKRADFLGTG